MAKGRPEKKPDLPAPRLPTTAHVLPMEVQPSDRLSDETAEWEVSGRPHSSSPGKIASVRVRKLDQSNYRDRDLERPRAHQREVSRAPRRARDDATAPESSSSGSSKENSPRNLSSGHSRRYGERRIWPTR